MKTRVVHHLVSLVCFSLITSFSFGQETLILSGRDFNSLQIIKNNEDIQLIQGYSKLDTFAKVSTKTAILGDVMLTSYNCTNHSSNLIYSFLVERTNSWTDEMRQFMNNENVEKTDNGYICILKITKGESNCTFWNYFIIKHNSIVFEFIDPCCTNEERMNYFTMLVKNLEFVHTDIK